MLLSTYGVGSVFIMLLLSSGAVGMDLHPAAKTNIDDSIVNSISSIVLVFINCWWERAESNHLPMPVICFTDRRPPLVFTPVKLAGAEGIEPSSFG